MDKCFNCGAAVRSGAKFCTSCGTRLIDNPAAPASASTTTTAQPEASTWAASASASETQVAAPAADAETPETPAVTSGQPDDDAPYATWRRASSGWDTGASSESTTTTSPADRFEAALDAEKTRTQELASTVKEDFGWGAPASNTEDRFASWSAAYGTASPSTPEEAPATEPESGDEGDVVAVESATIPSSDEPAAPTTTDSAGFTDGGDREVDYLSGDENISAGGPDSGIAAGRPSDQSDARQRATTLVEELRELIWKIGEQEPAAAGDTTDIRNTLSAARGHTSDFSDLERAISGVRENPRDIDALVQLGGQAARLEELLESHARLTSALDDAISKLQ